MTRAEIWSVIGAVALTVLLSSAVVHYPVLTVVAILTPIPLMFRWVTLLDYLVLGAPFMAYVSSLHVAASDAVIPLACIALLGLSAKRGVYGSVKFDLPMKMLLFCLAALAAVGLSVVVATSRVGSVDLQLALTDTAKIVVVLAYCVLVATMVASTDLENVFRTLRLWTYLAGALSVGSMLTQFAGIPLIPAGSVRSFGFFQDPNLYAGYLLVSFAVVLACEAWSSRPSTPFLLVFISGGVASTASRSGLATLVLLMLLALLYVRTRRVRRTLVLAAASGAWIAFGIFSGNPKLLVFPAFERLVTASGATGADPRFGLWQRAVELWAENPVTGIGIGQYVLYSGDVYGISARTGTGFVTHNTFLSFLAELGLVGVAVVLSGLAVVIRRTWMMGVLGSSVRNSFLIGLVAVSAQMMTLNLQNVRYVWIYFGVVVGMGFACHQNRGVWDEALRARVAAEESAHR